MIKIILTNYKTGSVYDIVKPSLEEANLEVERHLTLDNLFKPEREIVALSEAYDESDILSTRQEITPAVIGENEEVLVPEIIVDYVTLKAEYVIEITDITTEYEAQQLKLARIAEGKKARQCCEEIIDFIGGYNVERDLSLAQIQQMQAEFANVYSSLKANMPRTVKQLAQAIVASELVPQEMLDETLSILTKYGY